jgi:hypothetical protein
MKADNIQEGVGAIRHDVGVIRESMVENTVTIARAETRVEDLQGGVGAIRQNMIDEKVSHER